MSRTIALKRADVSPVGNVHRKEQAQWCLRGYRRDGPQCGRKGNAPIFADKTSDISENLSGDNISLRLRHPLGFVVLHRDHWKLLCSCCNVSMSWTTGESELTALKHDRHTPTSSTARTVVTRCLSEFYFQLLFFISTLPPPSPRRLGSVYETQPDATMWTFLALDCTP